MDIEPRRELALPVRAVTLVVCLLGLAACSGDRETSSNDEGAAPGDPGAVSAEQQGESGGGRQRASDRVPGDDGSVEETRVHFTDITTETGIDFRHVAGIDGSFWQPEGVVPGCAVFDYDGDGWEDIFFVNSGWLTPGLAEKRGSAPHALYRNRGDGTFENVTESAGLVETDPDAPDRYGHGCAVADYDGDGDLDLYVAELGPNRLYRNEGDGTFRQVAAEVGVDDSRWSADATFADLDLDGDLDLFVTNYCVWSTAGQVPYKSPQGEPDYVAPEAYEPVPDVYYRNDGDGTFTDATLEAGFNAAYGHGLGVVAADFDGDGRPDLYVANDGDENNLWIQGEDGRFTDQGLLSGSALNFTGDPEASMGITVGDVDEDGDWDLFLTHLSTETNTLYLNDGTGFFEDATDAWGLGAPSMPFTGFGTRFFDAELDGDLDLYVANGRVNRGEDSTGEWPYEQRDQFFLQEDGRYRELDPAEHPWLRPTRVTRGIAFGDLDRDGDIDLVVADAESPPRILRNDSNRGRHRWLGVWLADRGANREALGAVVTLTAASSKHTQVGRAQRRRVARDGSYASSSEPRALFGLPRTAETSLVQVRWPDGIDEYWTVDELDRDVRLERGTGRDRPVHPDALAEAGDGAEGERSAPGDQSLPGSSTPGSAGDPDATEPGEGALADAIPQLPSLEGIDPDIATRLREAHERVTAQPQDGMAWKNYGVSLYADGAEYAKSARALTQSAALAADDPTTTYLLSKAHEQLGNVGEEHRWLEQTLGLEEYAPARVRLGYMALAEGNAPEAERHFRTVLQDQPGNAAAWEGLGASLRRSGDLAEAIESLERAVEQAPRSRSAHYELGLAYRARGDLERATAQLQTAAQLQDQPLPDPWMDEMMAGRSGTSSLLGAAKDARLAGDLDRAHDLYAEYVAREPEDAIGWTNLAAILRDRGDLDGALSAASRSIELDPDRAEAFAIRAALLTTQGQVPEAITALRRSLEIRPDLAQAWMDLGRLLARQRDLAAARDAFFRYVELRPGDPEGFVALGEIQIGLRKMTEAKSAFHQVLRLTPEHPVAHFRLAGLAMRDQLPEEALDHFTAAAAARPDWGDAIYGKAMAHRMAGRTEQARTELRKALEIDPTSERYRRTLDALESP